MDNEMLCLPQNFMYREFRIPSSTKKSLFNFVEANNSNGFRNVIRVPKKITPGLIPIGAGQQGTVLLGCLDDKCKTKVSIKVSKPGESEPAIREYKINKQVYERCINETPHILRPIMQMKCRGDKIVTYYEFFNGGSLDKWWRRHAKKLKTDDIKVAMFQILYTMGIIYKNLPSFRHHDLHTGNVFIKTGDGVPKSGYTKYGKYEIKNNGMFTAVADFGFAHSPPHAHKNLLNGEYKKCS